VISRKGRRTITNEDDLIDLIESLGLIAIQARMEKLPLHEQAFLARSCVMMIGMHGAGIMNGTAYASIYCWTRTSLCSIAYLLTGQPSIRSISAKGWRSTPNGSQLHGPPQGLEEIRQLRENDGEPRPLLLRMARRVCRLPDQQHAHVQDRHDHARPRCTTANHSGSNVQGSCEASFIKLSKTRPIISNKKLADNICISRERERERDRNR